LARQKGETVMGNLLDKLDGGELIGLLVVLVPVVGGLLCGMVAIIAGNWRKIRRAEMEAALKQDMLNRGMSAEEIKTVLEAGSRSSRKDFRSHHLCRD
jgi:hypothetical protein